MPLHSLFYSQLIRGMKRRLLRRMWVLVTDKMDRVKRNEEACSEYISEREMRKKRMVLDAMKEEHSIRSRYVDSAA